MKARHILAIVDLSGSTSMEDPRLKMSKRDAILRALNDREEGFANFVVGSELEARLDPGRINHIYFSLGYFGDKGYSSGRDYLFTLAGRDTKIMSLAELREELLSDPSREILPASQLDAVKSNGTDLGQLENAIRSAVKLLEGRYGHYRVSVIVYTDGCFNMYRGESLTPENVYKTIREVHESLVSDYSDILRGILVLLYGDNQGFEHDWHICPFRAALLAGRREEQSEAMQKAVEQMLHQGVIEFDEEWDQYGEVPEAGGRVSDYNVFRLRKPQNLANALATMTTVVGS